MIQKNHILTCLESLADAPVLLRAKRGPGKKPRVALQIVRDAEACVHCGACVAHCNTDALSIDSQSYEVEYRDDLCSKCGLCIPACSFAVISATG